MRKTLLLGLILFSACQPEPEPESTSSSAVTGYEPCAVVGAVADDGLDDGPAIRAALESGARCAELGPGTYDVYTRRDTGHYYDMLLLSGGARLTGQGPSTTIRFSGDAEQHDWRGVTIMGDDNEISSLRLDTSDLVDTEEQTHAVLIFGPAKNSTIENVWFYHPQRGPAPGYLGGGDCIKIAGYDPNQSIKSVIIRGNTFVDCDRSGVSVHGGVHGMTIAANTFLHTYDQDIDAESTEPNSDWAIVGNVIKHDSSQSLWAVDLTSGNFFDRLTFTGNTIENGGVVTLNVRNIVFSSNVVSSPGMALQLSKVAEDVTISGNTLTTLPGVYSASTLRLTHHNTGRPGSVVITGNRIKTGATYSGTIAMESIKDATIAGNALEYAPTVQPPGAVVFVYVGGTGMHVDAITVGANTMRATPPPGFTTFSQPIWGVFASATSEQGVGRMTVTGNTYLGLSVGVRCENFTTGTVVSTGNQGAANQCSVASAGN